MNEPRWDELKSWLTADEFQKLERAVNKATQLNHLQAQHLRGLNDEGWITSQWYLAQLLETIKETYRCQGISERIKNTPLLRQYSFFTQHFVWVFVLLMPLGLVQHFKPMAGFLMMNFTTYLILNFQLIAALFT